MNKEELTGSFIHSPRLLELADRISISANEKIYLSGLQGSASQFIINAVFNHLSCAALNHLVVLNDAEEAAYFHNTLESISNALDLFYFPSSFKNKKNFKLLNSSHVMLRTETLTRLSAGGNKKIVVTYPEALFEKVVLPKTLSGNIIYIKAGDAIDLNGMMEKFVNYGFERTDFVYEPGQFALRGGILDIYSFGNEKPYRIELFGNDVDSIRIFDPETQLSERKLLQLSIIPNIETQFESADKVTLPEFMPENTIVWVQDWEVVKEKMLVQEEDLSLYLQLIEQQLQEPQQPKSKRAPEEEDGQNEKAKINPADFVGPEIIEHLLVKQRVVEFGYSSFLKGMRSCLIQRLNPLLTASSTCS